MTVASPLYPVYDGAARYYNGTGTWSSIRGQSVGTDTYDALDPSWICYSDASLPLIGRGFFVFDTSGLPDNAVADTGTTLTFTGTSKVGTGGSVCLVASNQASPTALVAADYSRFGTTELAARIPVSSWNTSGTNVFTLNAAGLAAINASGYTQFCVVHSSDLDNASPASPAAAYANYSEHTGTGSDPVLSVTYHLAGTGADSLSFTDTGDVHAAGGGATTNRGRTGADSLSFTDTTGAVNPATRTAGTQRSVLPSGTIGTTGAHFGFPTIVRTGTPTTPANLVVLCRRGTSHASRDGSLVCTISSDDGVTWSAPTVVRDYSVTGYDARDVQAEVLPAGDAHAGRIVVVHSEYKQISGHDAQRTISFYSDDGGVTWSTPVVVSTGMYDGSGTNGGNDVGSDIVRRPNGDLLIVGYATETDNATKKFGLYVTKSTDGGATWANLSKPVTWSTYSANAVEPQIEQLENGKLFMTFHIENGPPQYCYYTTSTDGGATWATPTLFDTNVLNRQGLAKADYGRRVLITEQAYTAQGAWKYYESTPYATSFPVASVSVAASGFQGGSETYTLWCMGVGLAGQGASQNVGFVYSSELIGDAASVFFKPFSGLDGSFQNLRSGADALSLTDTGARAAQTFSRSGADALSLTDTGVRSPLARSRSGADNLTLTDTAARAANTYSVTGADTIAFTDTAGRASVTIAPTGTRTIQTQGMNPGTSIGAYRMREWRGAIAAKLNAGPGSVVDTQTIADDLTVTFSGLDNGEWVAYAPAYPKRRHYFFIP